MIKFIPGMQEWFNSGKSINAMKDKSHLITLIHAEKNSLKFNIPQY
jgi:hypothetical protein